MTNQSLTIVLPVYNGESRLHDCVDEILELASELTREFALLIIDDGSSDDTFAAAEELAARYPQISVRRHRHRRGLGATMEYIERRVSTDVVIVHDGVTPIDPNQVRRLWRSSMNHPGQRRNGSAPSLKADLADLATLPAAHIALEKAHSRVLGFQLLMPKSRHGGVSPADVSRGMIAPRTDAAHSPQQEGVGQIPPLPRPKFFSALADFAFGE